MQLLRPRHERSVLERRPNNKQRKRRSVQLGKRRNAMLSGRNSMNKRVSRGNERRKRKSDAQKGRVVVEFCAVRSLY